MRTYYIFQSKTAPELRGFAEGATGETLPSDQGPWVSPADRPRRRMDLGISRAVVAAGIIENGFYLWGPINRAPSPIR